MDSSTIRRLSEKSAYLEKWMIPILLLLVLIVGGIRIFPWLNTKLRTITDNQSVEHQQITTSDDGISSNSNIEVDTRLAPIITDRSVPLTEARSQQLTEFLSNLNDTPEITVTANSNYGILQNEIELPNKPSPVITANPKATIIAPPPVLTETPKTDPPTIQAVEQPNASSKPLTAAPSVVEGTDKNAQMMESRNTTVKQTEPAQNTVLTTTRDNAVLPPTEPNTKNSAIPATGVTEPPAQKTASKVDPSPPAAPDTVLSSIHIGAPDSQKTRSPDNAQTVSETEVVRAITESKNPDSVIESQIKTIINQWASAWSKQAVEQYLQFYTSDMTAPKYKTHEKWRAWRTARLTKPNSISVGIEEVEITLNDSDPNRATARFIQHYNADTYSDKVIKTLELVNIDGRWLIGREKSFTISK